jgi:L-fuconate dehydratase
VVLYHRFGVPVCPHAGGVGLCEYVIHLRQVFSFEGDAEMLILPGSLIDYIAVSGTMERNVLEYVDHLHEHFLYPCSVNQKGKYNVPGNPMEGYRWISVFPVCEILTHDMSYL